MAGPRVTIVTSVKEQFGRCPEQLRTLRSMAPGVPVILVLSGPMGPSTERAIRGEAALNPELRLLETGVDFGNPFELRSRALPLVSTPLVLFLFNDVLPVNEAWLSGLLAAADAHPEADLFQPFIWEGDETPHAAWKDLYFVRIGGRIHVVHPYDREYKARRDPSALPSVEQPFFLEDHAFLARTEFMKTQSILDPGCGYAKEYLDFALTARYQGAVIRFVPASQVQFQLNAPVSQEDLLFYVHRRDEELSAGSAVHLRRKWGVELPYDGIGRDLLSRRLSGVAWSGADLPADTLRQRELVLAFLVAVGYNRFALGEGEEGVDLPSLYPRFRARPADAPLRLVASRATKVAAFPDFTPDYAERAEALRGGRLFPVLDAPAGDVGVPERGLEFEPFLLVEAAFEVRVPEALASHASLIAREPGGRHRAWIHVRYRPGERAAMEASARGELIVHRSEEGRAVSTRIDLEPGWALVQWAWRPQKLDVLSQILS